MMKIGYARVSTRDQNPDLQIDALKKEGCEKIYQDTASGAKSERPELDKLLATVGPGDVVVFWKLDRLGRSLRHLVNLVEDLSKRKVILKSIDGNIDMTTNQGRMVFGIFAALAEFERDMIRERTQAGLSSARARGRLGGRPKGLSEKAAETAMVAETLYKEGNLSVNAISERLDISKGTLYRYLHHRGVKIGPYQKKSTPMNASGKASRKPKSAEHTQAEKELR
jgi:DNA invertase Pin-like site-specific DNA recombinase